MDFCKTYLKIISLVLTITASLTLFQEINSLLLLLLFPFLHVYVIVSSNCMQDPYFPESVQQLKPNKVQLKYKLLRNTEINMKPILMPSLTCATGQKTFSTGISKNKRVQAGIIIFVNVPTIDVNPQTVNLARQMNLNFYISKEKGPSSLDKKISSHHCISVSLSESVCPLFSGF